MSKVWIPKTKRKENKSRGENSKKVEIPKTKIKEKSGEERKTKEKREP